MNMYKVTKRMEVSAAHNLSLPYDSPCNGLHGHNWIIEVELSSPMLSKLGMIIDFSHIKEAVHGKIDHKCLNDILDFNTTAENMTDWVRDQCDKAIGIHAGELRKFAFCSRVEIWETEGNSAVWEKQL